MPEIAFLDPHGVRHLVQAELGRSVMRVAIEAGIPGIIAECGGCMTCATCHVYVEAERLNDLPPPSDRERMMVAALLESRPNSRLSCQVQLSAKLSDIMFTVPPTQG